MKSSHFSVNVPYTCIIYICDIIYVSFISKVSLVDSLSYIIIFNTFCNIRFSHPILWSFKSIFKKYSLYLLCLFNVTFVSSMSLFVSSMSLSFLQCQNTGITKNVTKPRESMNPDDSDKFLRFLVSTYNISQAQVTLAISR